MLSVTIIIPVYKKHELLLASLTNNIPFLARAKIIIINDDPKSQLHEDHYNRLSSDIVFLQNEKNLGFAKTINVAVRHTKTDLVMLLNTDVFLNGSDWHKTLEHFEKSPETFAISFAQDDGSGNVTGRNQLYFANGLFHHSAMHSFPNTAHSTQHMELLPTAWAEGGSAIFKRSMWEELGGFDESFSPFYWEDVDLSFRAKKHGWHVFFCPDIQVLHKHESTIGSYFDKDQINKIAYAHQIYFTKKHANPIQKLQFYFFLMKKFLKSLINSPKT